jgi:hypothetical protein
MTAGVVVPARAARRPLALAALVALVSAFAAAGTLLAILTLSTGHDEAGVAEAPVMGQPVTTSFGSLTILGIATVGGLTSQELGGVTHGIQNLVLSDKAQVEVSAVLVNTGSSPVRVEPSQFRLLVDGTPDPVVATGSTMQVVSLRPGASVEAGVTFVVPQAGAAMTVSYQDPGTAALIRVPVGVLGQAPAVPDDGHSH